MAYVDGFVIPVSTANREKFREHAAAFAPIFKDFGALRVVECWGHDVPEGEVTSFPMAVKRTPDETVVFSWVEWPDKATRDRAHAEMMKDPRFESIREPMPFDGKRMIFGGFEPIVDE
jgi:uncharacterized protein YbaA (DUF1428 family)